MARTDLEAFGRLGERFVVEQLRRRGFTAELIGESSDYDILLEGRAKVEVKSAFLTEQHRGRGRYQFSLRRHGAEIDEDILFLLCYEDVEAAPIAVFVIPGHALPATLSKIDITSRNPRQYMGKWAPYLGAWDVVRRTVNRLPFTKPDLFRTARPDAIPF
jgi:hypothetical protein